MGIFKYFIAQSPENKFWNWFLRYSQKFISLDGLSDKRLPILLGPISERLGKYCDGLTYEIGYDKVARIYELVVSADGYKKIFPKVESLVNAAPDIKNWKITAFRQPKGDSQKIEYAGYIFDSDIILFLPKINPEIFTEINIEVVYPDYTEENRNILLGGTFLLLDAIIGEKATETDISYINVSKTPDNLKDYKSYHLCEIRNFIHSKKNDTFEITDRSVR